MPTPTLPCESMWKTVVVADAVEELTVKRGTVPREAPATESLPHGVVVERPRLPTLSRRMYSVSEPEMFLVEKVRTEVGVASVTSVRIAAMRAVEVAVEVARP